MIKTWRSVVWKDRDEAGKKVASGKYFYKLSADGFSENEETDFFAIILYEEAV
jgi:hypothetical protein